MADELRDLRWAIIASQHRSLRRAAETLNIRQSTLSRRLRDLEHRRGVQLFQRTNGGTKLTPAGSEFLTAARRILEAADQIFTKVRARARGETGHLTIGVYTSLAAGNLRATLIEYHACFPNVSVRVIDGRRSELLADLAAGVIDVNIMTSDDEDWDDCRLPLWSERVVVALPKGHILADRSIIQWSEIKNERLIIPERGPAPEFEQLLTRKLGNSSLGRTLPQAAGLDRLLSLVGILNEPLLVLEGATGAQYEDVVYREVHDGDGPTRLDFSAHWRGDNNNPTLEPFLDILRRRYPNLRRAQSVANSASDAASLRNRGPSP